MTILGYILIMALVTYLIRMLPFTLFRKQITSRFFRSLMHYIPYAVLSAMTIPSIFYATGSMITAAVGTAVALVLAWFDRPLIIVALCAAGAALVTGLIV
ncbi:MAG: AzlD domain-containing protein [Eubacterium sp.]|nr:AzlD domain-containing protein [Eubacterium sp.]